MTLEDEDELMAPTRLTPADKPAGAQLEPLHVVVIGPGAFATYPLPERASLTIGRSARSDIPIDDTSISRHHATLRVDDTLTIEDLGSANGTIVRGQPIERGRPTAIEIGELVGIGSANLVIQRRSSGERSRRLWTHDHFESRLEEECARAQRAGTAFGLLRIQVERDDAAQRLQETICETLRRSDVVGMYGPFEYQVLLVDTPPREALDTMNRLLAKLRERGLRAKAYLACYPSDGRDPHALTAKLGEATRRAARDTAAPIVVSNPVMDRIYGLVAQVAASEIAVLLLGETGVGKEVIAKAIHRASPRATGPFVAINCAALTETLLESELFGHDKGAFTGADSAKAGLLEAAEGGTVLLDEIGEMPPGTQAKLLRVLEDRQVRRVGAVKGRAIDTRFIAATNRDLAASVAANEFRRDLYYRLNGISIAIPPLRDRVSEVEPLARMFAGRAGGARSAPEITPQALELLRSFAWPGNVRELKHMIERAVLLCGDAPIGIEHLPAEMMRSTITVGGTGRGSSGALDDDESIRVAAALDRTYGNQTKAASLLGISRRTLINRIEKYGLARPRKKH